MAPILKSILLAHVDRSITAVQELLISRIFRQVADLLILSWPRVNQSELEFTNQMVYLFSGFSYGRKFTFGLPVENDIKCLDIKLEFRKKSCGLGL